MEAKLKLSVRELEDAATEHLTKLDDPNASYTTKANATALAQFYLAEIDRRDSTQIAQRDYKLEVWVIVLIGLELVLAIAAIVAGWVENKNQQNVLDQLNKSGAETARTLTAVREAQEASVETQKHTLENLVAMNSALQDEMDLNITEALQWVGGSSEGVIISNRGRTTLFLWGSKFAGQPPKMLRKATVLVPSNSATFDVSAVVAMSAQTNGASGQPSIPFELYFTRQNGTKYISKGTMQITPNRTVWIDGMTSVRKQW